jgi:hypothetical protein
VNIAEINTETGIVSNLIVADEMLVDPTAVLTYVEYTDDNPAHIGLEWHPIGGFVQPPVVNRWADDYVPPEAAPDITDAEFEEMLKKHEESRTRGE